jgi:hypothetical protein
VQRDWIGGFVSKFIERKFILRDSDVLSLAIAAATCAPTGIEMVLREPVKARKLDQNALYWAGPLKDIAEQAWLCGQKYADLVWHEHFKREFLPDEDEPNIAELVKSPEKYRKWAAMPNGVGVCIGSTTELTVKGFSQYLEQVHAFGASLGVMFMAKS